MYVFVGGRSVIKTWFCALAGFKVRFFSVNPTGRQSVSFSFVVLMNVHRSIIKGLNLFIVGCYISMFTLK